MSKAEPNTLIDVGFRSSTQPTLLNLNIEPLNSNVGKLQEINYPILWGGHPARPVYMAGETPTPQELIGYFFIWKSVAAFISNVAPLSLEIAAFISNVAPLSLEIAAFIFNVAALISNVAAFILEVAALISNVAAFIFNVAAFILEVAAFILEVAAFILEVAAFILEVAAFIFNADLSN